MTPLRLLWAAAFMTLAAAPLAWGPPGPVGEGQPFRQPFTVDVAPDGRLLVVDFGRVLAVDPATGDREVAVEGDSVEGVVAEPGGGLLVLDGRTVRRTSGEVVSAAGRRGRGPALRAPARMAWLEPGVLAVLDRDRVVRVDVSTGDRSVLAGAGPAFLEADDLLVLDGRLLVVDNRRGQVLEVDPRSGDRRVALDLRRLPAPRIYRPSALGVGADGTVLVAHPNLARVVAWNPRDGSHRVVTTPEAAAGVLTAVVEDVAGLPDGSLVCADARAGALVRVAPDGHRTVLSGRGLPRGRLEAMPYAIAPGPDGALLAVDGLRARLLSVDPFTGTFREVSGPGRGTGPAFAAPNEVAAGDGRAWVVDLREGLLEVDLGTGDRRLVETAAPGMEYDVQAAPDGRLYLLHMHPPGILEIREGRALEGGEPLADPLRLAWTGSGRLLVTDAGRDLLLQVDPATGRRTRLSGPAGAGLLEAVTETADGTVLVTDGDSGRLMAVGKGGRRTLVSGPDRGHGPRLDAPEDLVERSDGRILVCDPGAPGLVVVDPATGGRALLPLTER